VTVKQIQHLSEMSV